MKMVKLTPSQNFNHYLLPATLALIGIIPLCFWIFGKASKNLTFSTAIFISSAIILLAYLSFRKQRADLKFYSIVSNADTKTKNTIVRKILRSYKWEYLNDEHNYIQASGYGFRDTLDLRTWSELITIIIKPDNILINSICDPDGFLPQALMSFGKNKQNVKDFEKLYFEAFQQNG